jgi:hypothetical protein
MIAEIVSIGQAGSRWVESELLALKALPTGW